MKQLKLSIIIFTVILFLSCEKKLEKTDPLPSWNEGKSKQSIIDFVNDVTNEKSPNYVKPEDRIATFDNDGTLWSEQPYYFQLAFALDRIKAMAPDHPEWTSTQPFKAVLENDLKTIMESRMKGLMEIIMTSHAGMTTTEFEKIVTDWINTAKHPKTNKLYKEMVFQPMLELLEYLRANEFKTYIVSGGGIEFMRPWTEEVYGIPSEQVIGSSVKTRFEFIDGKPVLVRLPEIDFIDDKEGKPVGIHKFIGKRPIAAFGNSDGDLQMLQWTAATPDRGQAGDGKRLMLIVHHTDAEREWAYDRESHIGKLDKALDEANAKGWTVVDMKNDWNKIYP
ncbi:MAG: haloacid dehalogenase [Bacteroidetes bacterium RBG_19FT_COMBO_42_10]|nr:MAG: haloacid dehalogenase [Bacteroidetes bacterium RBG_19FT_COMBO_42_10]